MAPFKLKFRMGGNSSTRRNSASSSQDHEQDPQVNEALLDQQHIPNMSIAASSTTIDSIDCSSMSSIGGHSEHKLLLPNRVRNNQRIGYLNQNQETSNTNLSASSPQSHSPPPLLYETESIKSLQQFLDGSNDNHSVNDSQNTLMLEHLNLNGVSDSYKKGANYVEVYQDNSEDNEGRCKERRTSLSEGRQHDNLQRVNCNLAYNPLNKLDLEVRKESIDSQEFLLSDTLNDTEDDERNPEQGAGTARDTEDMVDKCTNLECRQYMAALKASRSGGGSGSSMASYIINKHDPNRCGHQILENQYESHGGQQLQAFQDPLTDYKRYYNNDTQSRHYEEAHSSSNPNLMGASMNGSCTYEDHSQAYECDYDDYQGLERCLTPEITSNKSSKEIYRNLAKQWGLTCKLSDGCRCMDCQSNYFDCEFEENEHQKTDGGLGAGTPMFISEVMHGTACSIL